MDINQSHDWLGNAMKKQMAAANHTADTIPIEILETFWVPRCTEPNHQWNNYFQLTDFRKVLILSIKKASETYIINHDLDQSNSCQQNSMYWKCNIISSYWDHLHQAQSQRNKPMKQINTCKSTQIWKQRKNTIDSH